MINEHNVTILEYFAEMRRMQKDTNSTNVYKYAREYMQNRCGFEKQGIAFINWLGQSAQAQGRTPRQLACTLALKELNLRIEDDMMEYAAELGVSTYNATRLDFLRAKREATFFEVYGYAPHDTKLSEVKVLKKNTELYFVERADRPLYVVDISNPFLKNDECPFVPDTKDDLDEVFSQKVLTMTNSQEEKNPVIMSIPDWDKLSEDDWQLMREAQEEARLHDKIKRTAEHSRMMINTSFDFSDNYKVKALSLIDEYSDRFDIYD